SPLAADNFYRIKAISLDGQVQYSAIVKVGALRNTAAVIAVHPNPVLNKQMNIAFENQPKGRYTVELIGVNGQVVYQGAIVVNNANFNETVYLNQHLAGGWYQLRVTGQDGTVTSEAVFIK
ncbi:MAG: T9SS type A sorting domain-containing protein, partial [Sphingobacteriales bacterium]